MQWRRGKGQPCFSLLHMMYYNFVRIHQTLKISPAMAAGVTDKLWEMSDMVKVLEDWEAGQKATEPMGDFNVSRCYYRCCMRNGRGLCQSGN
jgi:hypothetical protein